MPSEYISTSPTASTRPSFNSRAWAIMSTPEAGFRMKSIEQFVVTARAFGPTIARMAR